MNVSFPAPLHEFTRDNEAAFRREVELHFRTILKPVAGTGIPSTPPATAAAAGTVGTITWDATHIYVCIASNTWVRATLATW